MELKQLLESSQNGHRNMMTEAQTLVKKWEPTGLLEQLEAEKYGKENMAIILENQAKRLVVESSQTGTGASFSAGAGEQWAGVALPLVRKVFAEISSKEFVSVQPMSLPSGLVFYLEFKYGNQQPTLGAGGVGRFNQNDSVYGVTNQKNANPYGGLYGGGRFGYSTNETSSAVLTASVAYSTASYADVQFNSLYSASVAGGFWRKVAISAASTNLPSLDKNGVRSFMITSSQLSEAITYADFTTYDSASDTISFIVSGALAYASAGTVTVYYSKQPTDNSRGDFEDRSDRPLTGSSSIPELDIQLNSVPIVAKTKKLKGTWTPEFSQDLNAYQSLDAEAEITAVLSEYISAEIDLEILDMLIQNANTIEYWSAQNNTVINPTGTAFVGLGSGFYNTQGSWFATLGTKIQKVSNIIHKKTLRGGANVLMTSPEISTVIESIPGYASDTNGDKMQYAMGTQKAGSLNSRWKVFKNPYMNENTILVAYKGTQFLETGAVFAPYVPLIMTPLLYDPNTFTPRKGLMTRFAKQMVRNEFYAKIYVEGLNTI